MIRTKQLVMGLGFLGLLVIGGFFLVSGKQVTLAILPEQIVFNTPRDLYGVGSNLTENTFDREAFIASVRSALKREERVVPVEKEKQVTETSPVVFEVEAIGREGVPTTATATISTNEISFSSTTATSTTTP